MARIQSIDILRGGTIALMVLVNNPGNWQYNWAPLHHAEWNGLMFADLVFPLFLFIMGVSMYFSLSKGGFKLSWKMLRRALLLILIGLVLNWLSGAVWGGGLSLSGLRYTGVLQRFALCFGISALLICLLPRKSLPWIAIILLAGYSVALLLGDGYVYGPENIVARADRAIIPQNHLYNDHGIDPEGLLSTIPGIAHTLIGFLVGALIGKRRQGETLLVGIGLLAIGLLASIWLPVNKKIWSPSFVLVLCGIGTLLLCGIYYLTDEKAVWRKSGFFKAFGSNAIYCYVISHFIGWAFILCGFQRWISQLCTDIGANSPISATLISLGYSLLVVLVTSLTTLPLYKKGIYIKV